MTVAPSTASTSGVSRWSCFFPMTLSTRYFVEMGSTNPQMRLTIISAKPAARIPRRGRIISRMSGHNSRSRSDERFLEVCGFTADSTIVFDAPLSLLDALTNHAETLLRYFGFCLSKLETGFLSGKAAIQEILVLLFAAAEC